MVPCSLLVPGERFDANRRQMAAVVVGRLVVCLMTADGVRGGGLSIGGSTYPPDPPPLSPKKIDTDYL